MIGFFVFRLALLFFFLSESRSVQFELNLWSKMGNSHRPKKATTFTLAETSQFKKKSKIFFFCSVSTKKKTQAVARTHAKTLQKNELE